jgi:hypothetical protein
MSLLNSPASRTSPRLVASQPMAYLFIGGGMSFVDTLSRI